MRTALFLLLVAPLPALAGAPLDVAFERFSYEVSKPTNLIERNQSLAEYANNLFRLDAFPRSLPECVRSIQTDQVSFPDCEPVRVRFARGGSGGVE